MTLSTPPTIAIRNRTEATGKNRCNDPNHPRAKEEDFKIQIGQLIQLEKPIIADQWRRITFFYTTGNLLKSATTIRDLVVTGEDRFVLWKNLRERMENLNMDDLPVQDFSEWNVNFIKLLSDWDKIKGSRK